MDVVVIVVILIIFLVGAYAAYKFKYKSSRGSAADSYSKQASEERSSLKITADKNNTAVGSQNDRNSWSYKVSNLIAPTSGENPKERTSANFR